MLKARSLWIVLIYFFICSFLSSCSKRKYQLESSFQLLSPILENTKEKLNLKEQFPLEVSEKNFFQKIYQQEWGEVKYVEIKEEILEVQKKESQETQLEEISLPEEFQKKAFRFVQPGQQDTIVISPHILIKNSVLGLNPYLEKKDSEEDDEIIMDLSIALLNGLESEVETGKGKQPISAELLIPNKEEFLKHLGESPQFVSQMKCPEKVRLKMENEEKEFPIQLTSETDSCPINAFFPAKIRIKKSQWIKFQKGFLKDGALEMTSEINLSVPLATEFAEWKILGSYIYDWLRKKENLEDKEISPQEMEALLCQLIDEIQQKNNFNFDQNQFITFKGEIIKDFFQEKEKEDFLSEIFYKFESDVSKKIKEKEYRIFSKKEEYVGKPIRFETTSFLVESMGKEQAFLVQAKMDSQVTPLTPEQGRKSRLAIALHEGQLIEFKIENIFKTALTFENPEVEFFLNEVPLNTYSVVTNGSWMCHVEPTAADLMNAQEFKCPWTGKKFEEPNGFCGVLLRRANVPRFICGTALFHGGMNPSIKENIVPFEELSHIKKIMDNFNQSFADGFPRPPLPLRLDDPILLSQPWKIKFPHLDWVSTSILRDRFDPEDLQEQWIRTTRWSLPIQQPSLIDSPITEELVRKIIESMTLELQFQLKEEQEPQTRSCILKDMEYEIMPENRLFLEIKNSERCNFFDERTRLSEVPPIVHIINYATDETRLPFGKMTENWKGERKYECISPDGSLQTLETTVFEDEQRQIHGGSIGIQIPYFSRLQLQGKLKKVGDSFQNTLEREVLP